MNSLKLVELINEDIAWFFAHYKTKDTDGKWSRVDGTLNTDQATDIYSTAIQKYQQNI